MIPLLVLRPEPGAAATAARARELGLEVILAPLFAIRTIAPDLSTASAPPDALLLTSANAARSMGELSAPNAFAHLPIYAVGDATAAAARQAGFAHVIAGSGDAAAIVAQAAADGVRRLLHLAGRDHRAVLHPALTIDRAIVYAADPVRFLPPHARAALAWPAVALVHSPRAAQHLAELVPDRERHAIAAISRAAAEAAGQGWRTIAVAPVPTDAALLAVAARLCEGGG